MDEEVTTFNLLLKSDIETLTNFCFTSNTAHKICQDKYFWEQKFKHDNIKIITEQSLAISWIKEYKKVKQCIMDADDIITISLIEKDEDKRVETIYSNNGTIQILNGGDDLTRYNDHRVWYLPHELIDIISNKYKGLTLYPMIIKLTPIDDKYELKCEFYRKEDEHMIFEDYEASIEILLDDVKNIIFGALYDGIELIGDEEENLYIPKNNTIINDQHPFYDNTIKFSRIAILNTLKHLRSKI